MDGFALPLCICSLFIIFIISNASDTITQTQSIRDGETIVSSGGSFEMGFFSPGKSKNRYVGIWFKKISVITTIWVANREIPLTDTTGVLMVKSPGILVLLNGTNETIWSSNTSKSAQSPVAQLLDTGNLIIKNIDDDNLENSVWQSFDYPGNTQIPGMKFGKNLLTGKEWYFSSWKSEDDPSEGDFTYRMDINGYPQPILRTLGSETYRTGPWNGYQFSGSSNLGSNEFFEFSFVFNEEEVYYAYPFNSSEIMRGELSYDGHVKRWTWSKQKGAWVLYSNRPDDNCDHYAICGVNSICRVNYSPICTCMDKFSPKHPEDWDLGDWSKGCIRRKPLACESGEEGFLKYSGLKLADTSNSWFSINMTLEECGRMCLQNCSCVAYSNIDVRGKGSGCLLWFHDLIDMKGVPENGQDIYVRMPSSELEVVAKGGRNDRRKRKIIVSLASTIGGLLCLSLILYVWWRRMLMKRKGETTFSNNHNSESHNKDLSLPLFDLATIMKATDNFSMSNKVGEGGYGPVYKGLLDWGQEIAVKRLSKDSRQGLDEFKNEVIFIAKLQHRNLVKLLGYCIQGEDKMLIYEYMANKSLDSFIFDKTKSALLDWPMRFHIINGISRGLVYLHQDSRLRIIHRDLKTSNILLDTNMNPKISDFGMARSFKEKETEENTTRVVGTYGYMPPEYAMHGIFSAKSDVYSFGVLVLEIISGKRNRDFSHLDHPINLLGHAWKLYRDGRSLELVDASIISSCHVSEMLRSIHVALLCVQERRIDRPSMASVVLMLGSDTTLPQPKQPGFYTQKDYLQAECSTSRETPGSSSGITITEVEAR